MLVFLLKLSLAWGAFALLYGLLLRQETFFRANRAYLLLTAAAGLALPFAAAWFPEKNLGAGLPVVHLPEVVVGLGRAAESSKMFGWAAILTWIYAAGAALATARLAWGLGQIFRLAARSRSERWPDGNWVRRADGVGLPCSFFGWVFIGKDFGDAPESAQILAHERAHSRGWHSADVLFFECLCVVFWFHPLAHWYRRTARAVHEFLADEGAARTSNRKQYGLLLIRQSQSGLAPALANHFFTPQLKTRIAMLTKKASAPVRGLKYALALPLVPFFALLFQQNIALAQAMSSAEIQKLEANGWIALDTVTTYDPATGKEDTKIVQRDLKPTLGSDGKLVYRVADVLPEFPGGMPELMKFMGNTMSYPAEARKAGAEGKVLVKFIVDETGRVNEARQADSGEANLHPALVQEAIRVILAMPRWKPATHHGKPVNCQMALPVKFRLN